MGLRILRPNAKVSTSAVIAIPKALLDQGVEDESKTWPLAQGDSRDTLRQELVGRVTRRPLANVASAEIVAAHAEAIIKGGQASPQSPVDLATLLDLL